MHTVSHGQTKASSFVCPSGAGGLHLLVFEQVAAGGDSGKSDESTEKAEAAEQEALEELGVLLEKKAEANTKLTGSSLESMLAGMEVRGGPCPASRPHRR